MPLTAGSGQLQIVASQDLGDLGPTEGKPALFQWQWYYSIPSLIPWMLMALLLVLPKDNRTWQAWLILVPLLLIMAFWQAIVKLLAMPSSVAEIYGVLYGSLALAWILVWLLSHWLGGRRGAAAFFLALAVMLAVGALSYLCHFGTAYADDLLPFLTIYGICALALLLAMTLSGYCCRRQYRPRRFMLWLLLWIVVVPTVSMFILAIIWAINMRDMSLILLTSVVIVPVFLGGILYLMNLPVMVLAFCCPCYRDRFHNVFGLQDVTCRT